MKNTLPLLLAACAMSACQNVPGSHSWEPTLGVDYTLLGEYDLELAALGYTLETDVDYRVVQFEFGATKVDRSGDKPVKREFAGFRLGFGEVEDDEVDASVDIWELSGGGRWYFQSDGVLIPYFSLWSVLSSFEDVDTPQLGVRVGGGLEYPLDEIFFLRAELDYLFPILEGEDDFGIDVEGDGVALRLGISAYVP